jgi:hypothetical protein
MTGGSTFISGKTGYMCDYVIWVEEYIENNSKYTLQEGERCSGKSGNYYWWYK